MGKSWCKSSWKCFLWLVANIMCEYSISEAKELLNSNFENAKNQIMV